MRLSKFTDYAVRVCLYLSAHRDRTVPIAEIAQAHNVSHSNLMKVVNQLVDGGFLSSTRGRTGGVQLARDPAEVRAGEVVRHMEGEGAMVDCASCILLGSCGLVKVLRDAKSAFYAHLDQVTLADAVAAHPRTLDILLNAHGSDRAEAHTG